MSLSPVHTSIFPDCSNPQEFLPSTASSAGLADNVCPRILLMCIFEAGRVFTRDMGAAGVQAAEGILMCRPLCKEDFGDLGQLLVPL